MEKDLHLLSAVTSVLEEKNQEDQEWEYRESLEGKQN